MQFWLQCPNLPIWQKLLCNIFLFTCYNKFLKKPMSRKELTQEEANELCIQALILLSHQNRNHKLQKKSNPLPSPPVHPCKPGLAFLSSPSLKTHHSFPQSPLLQAELTSQKSPIKQDGALLDKGQLSEVASWKQLNQFSIQKEGESNEKEEKQNWNFFSKSSRQMPEQRFLEKNQLQKSGKLTQPGMDVEEKLIPESHIKELKRDLQIESRGKICKTQDIDQTTKKLTGYHLYCKNDSDCPFHCLLQVAGQRPTGQLLFKVIRDCDEHLKDCQEDEQEITFMKLTKLIDFMEQPIRDLLAKNKQMKPKEVLVWLAGQLGHSDHKFIYQGLKCKTYHKSAKKYFDNLVYRIKNPFSL